MSIFDEIQKLKASNKPGALCIVVETQGSTPRHAGSKMIVFPDGTSSGTIGGGEMESRAIKEAFEVMKDGRIRNLDYTFSDPERGDPGVCGGKMKIYIEPIRTKPLLVVIGCGHVGLQTARLGQWLGFHVTAIDDRTEFCNPTAFPYADDHLVGDLPIQVEKVDPERDGYYVFTTRSVDLDVPTLEILLKKSPHYVGVIGSRRRWEITQKQLSDKGLGADQIVQVKSPVGLEIGAETPEEIAVSIMAEIIKIRNQKS